MALDKLYADLLRQVAGVEQHFPLQQFNPLKAGGVADFYVAVEDTVELASAVKAAIDLTIPYLVIGQGVSVLFSDGGFPGLVIHNKSHAFSLAADRSQIVVDSGLSLAHFITMSAGRGLGGLTAFYGQEGTVGGAVYSNLTHGTQSILSSVRFITMIMPPAKIDREATIVRYRSDWLAKDDQQTKLQSWKLNKSLADPQPVILTVLLQLTSVRPDELQLRLHTQAKQVVKLKSAMGPIFETPPGTDIEYLLGRSRVSDLRVGNVRPDRRHPNYLVNRGVVRSGEIRELINLMQERVRDLYATELICRYEYVGVW